MLRSEELGLRDLVEAMSQVAANEQETPAVVAGFIDLDPVRLYGNAVGAMIELSAAMDAAA